MKVASEGRKIRFYRTPIESLSFEQLVLEIYSMAVTYLTFEQHAELTKLHQDYGEATTQAIRAIARSGMSSDEFRTAEKAAGVAARKIKELNGQSGRTWLAQ